MKIIVAMDSFKGSCSANEACSAVSQGIRQVFPDSHIICAPISDGGEGFIDSLYPTLHARDFKKETFTVMGPDFKSVDASFLYKGDQAILEMAQCSGLTLNHAPTLNGAQTTTYGLGQLVDHVISLGCTNIMMGLGGSATNDAGVGFAQALGAKFYDVHGQMIEDILCGDQLNLIASVDTTYLDQKLKDVVITGTCDVNNQLCGINGATYIFGPQKGIKKEQLALIDNKLLTFAKLLDKHYEKCALHTSGSGAAGGMGAALLWFGHGQLQSGIEVVLELLSLADEIKNSDLVIVGEGRIDGQSLQGKAPLGVAKLSAEHQVPVIALCGSIGDHAHQVYEHHISALFSICDGPMSLSYAMEHAQELLTKSSSNIMRLIKNI